MANALFVAQNSSQHKQNALKSILSELVIFISILPEMNNISK